MKTYFFLKSTHKFLNHQSAWSRFASKQRAAYRRLNAYLSEQNVTLWFRVPVGGLATKEEALCRSSKPKHASTENERPYNFSSCISSLIATTRVTERYSEVETYPWVEGYTQNPNRVTNCPCFCFFNKTQFCKLTDDVRLTPLKMSTHASRETVVDISAALEVVREINITMMPDCVEEIFHAIEKCEESNGKKSIVLNGCVTMFVLEKTSKL